MLGKVSCLKILKTQRVAVTEPNHSRDNDNNTEPLSHLFLTTVKVFYVPQTRLDLAKINKNDHDVFSFGA